MGHVTVGFVTSAITDFPTQLPKDLKFSYSAFVMYKP